jgi:hypothetical protein
VLFNPVDQMAGSNGIFPRLSSNQSVGATEDDLVEADQGTSEEVERRPGEVSGALQNDVRDSSAVDQTLDVDPGHQGVDVDPVEETIDIDPVEEQVHINPL